MFVREFFVTALRSAYEQRDLTMKTSYLAKAKTWTQMQGIGVMLLFPLVDEQGVSGRAAGRRGRRTARRDGRSCGSSARSSGAARS